MNKLQDALDRYDWLSAANDVVFPSDVIVEVLRRVANPDYEGWICFDSMGYPQRPDFHPYAGPDEDPHNDKCGRGIVIALGITE